MSPLTLFFSIQWGTIPQIEYADVTLITLAMIALVWTLKIQYIVGDDYTTSDTSAKFIVRYCKHARCEIGSHSDNYSNRLQFITVLHIQYVVWDFLNQDGNQGRWSQMLDCSELSWLVMLLQMSRWSVLKSVLITSLRVAKHVLMKCPDKHVLMSVQIMPLRVAKHVLMKCSDKHVPMSVLIMPLRFAEHVLMISEVVKCSDQDYKKG